MCASQNKGQVAKSCGQHCLVSEANATGGSMDERKRMTRPEEKKMPFPHIPRDPPDGQLTATTTTAYTVCMRSQANQATMV